MRNSRLLVVLAVGFAATHSQGQTKISSPPYGKSRRSFSPPPTPRATKSHPGDVDCMIDQMAKAGAPADP